MEKKFKKIAILFAFSLTSTLSSTAQISVGLTGGFATGMDLANSIPSSNNKSQKLISDFGFGSGLTSIYRLNEKMAVGLNFSYFSFGVKDFITGANVTKNYSVMPISLSFDYYFKDKGFKPFVGLELGYLICSYYAKYIYDLPDLAVKIDYDVSYTNNGLFLAPLIGVAYDLNDNFDITLNGKLILGLNGGKQDLKYINYDPTTIQLPTSKIDAISSAFVNINLGVSYKLGK